MHPDFRVVLIAMPSGSQLKSHKTAQRISVQVLAGHVTVALPERSLSLVSGGLLALDKSIVHEVAAMEDSTILLSLSGEPSHPLPLAKQHPLDSLSQEHKRFAKLLDLMAAEINEFQGGKEPD